MIRYPDSLAYGAILHLFPGIVGDPEHLQTRVERVLVVSPIVMEFFRAWISAREAVKVAKRNSSEGATLIKSLMTMAQIEGALAMLVATAELNPPEGFDETEMGDVMITPYDPDEEE